MAEASFPSPPAPLAAPAADGLPAVRLELRHGSARPTTHDVADVSFLIGSVPGCDLRLPGANLPPVLCLLSREPDGVTLRKLAPTQAVLVNARPVSSAPLADGDRLTIGPCELLVQVRLAPRGAVPIPQAPSPEPLNQLAEQIKELETDRVIWYRRREEMERECRELQEAAATAQSKLEEKERALALREQALAQRQRELDSSAGESNNLETVRQELDALRQRLYEHYRERRDRLAGLQEAVAKAAQNVQERKRQVDAEVSAFAAREAEVDARAADLERLGQRLTDEFTAREERCRQRELAVADLETQQKHIEDEHRLLERAQTQHRADLVRLDRREAQLDQRQKQLEARALEVDHRFEQLQRDSRELEEQARRLDEWHTKLQGDAERLALESQHARSDEVAQRAAALEGQQAVLATLRTRLERLREEVRRESQLLTEQRTRQEAAEQEIAQRLEEARRLREELEGERLFQEQERKRFEERNAALEETVVRTVRAQEALAADEARLREQTQDVEARTAALTEQTAVLEARAAQLTELQQRLDADRQALRERERTLAQTEEVRAALQAQLHRRGEELAVRQRSLSEIEKQHASTSAVYQQQLAEIEAARADLERARQQTDADCAAQRQALETAQAEMAIRERHLEAGRQKLAEAGASLAAQRKALAEERDRRAADQTAAAQFVEQSKAELEADRHEALALQRHLPELELRAREAVERLSTAKERLREHLAELHSYARQNQEDLEALRTQVEAEAEQVRQQRLTLHRARDEHRLAVTAFRQHIIDWQGQVGDMKRMLARGETRLERRRAEVDAQARDVDVTSARLAQQAQVLEDQQRQVAVRRTEIERHLEDMRQWYRSKLRELAIGADSAPPTEAPAAPAAEMPVEPASERNILALTGDVEAGDRQLGDLMRSLELVDADTLNALLIEARRQRRSLRQVLLAGNYLTLYQLALIEAGNVDALVLGPTRVIDRLRAGARETVYRVFDPRHGKECVLRHLSESAAAAPGHAEEFRQGFTAAAAIQHPHVVATLEVLDIGGRPAALQEYTAGLPSTDWPALAAVPGVWYRLLSQAAVGLHAAHQAGAIHGHIRPELVFLTGEGVVKLHGFGAPPWLLEPVATEDGLPAAIVWGEDASADLAALGAVALGWAAATRRKGTKTKPLPEALQAILLRLTADADDDRLLTAAALLEALDAAGNDVPPNAEAWDRLLHHVREHLPAEAALRQSA